MFGEIAAILGPALSIWQHKEQHKYQDQLIKIMKGYYEEYNKPDAERSDAALDDWFFQLRILGRSFATEVGASNAPAIPGSTGV